MISEFQGQYRWLSNFEPVEIKLDGIKYPSVEHAYMSAKSNSREWKEFCSNPNNKAGLIKRESRKIILIRGWDLIKLDIMRECVKQKFSQQPFRKKLIETCGQHLQEGNYWEDKYWGVCLKTNIGENNLGKIIMSIRDVLVNENILKYKLLGWYFEQKRNKNDLFLVRGDYQTFRIEVSERIGKDLSFKGAIKNANMEELSYLDITIGLQEINLI